jgi:hypothetical protein
MFTEFLLDHGNVTRTNNPGSISTKVERPACHKGLAGRNPIPSFAGRALSIGKARVVAL